MLTKYAASGAAVAAITAATPATTGAFNSTDRSGDRIMLDPQADNTDLYAFTAVSNWIPLPSPAGGPYSASSTPPATYWTTAHAAIRAPLDECLPAAS